MSTRRGGNPVKGLLGRTGEVHPVVSAAIFGHHATTPWEGTIGSTMNVRTGKVEQPHSPGYIVGGEPDRRGRRVPTESEPVSGNASLDRVLHHRRRVASTTDAPHAAMGYWAEVPGMKSYDVDSSAIFHDRRTAMKVGRKRGETAVWDMGKMKPLYPQRGGDPDRRPRR